MAWTTITALGSNGSTATTTLINAIINDVNQLRTPAAYTYIKPGADSNYTISGTSYGAIDGTNLSKQLVTTGNPVVSTLQIGRVAVTTGPLFLTMYVGGVDQSYSGNGFCYVNTTTSTISWIWNSGTLTAGTYTFALYGKVTAGSAVLYPVNGIQWDIREL